MNKTPAEATELINAIKPLVADATCDVVVGVPFIDLPAALEATAGTNIGVAAQNCYWEKSGAFTGEIAAATSSSATASAAPTSAIPTRPLRSACAARWMRV